MMRTKILPLVLAAVRCWRPAAPVVPPLLWATGAAVGLAGLNLVFSTEIWSAGAAISGGWLVLSVLLLLVGMQAVSVLLRWPPPPLAPRWGQGLWHLGKGALVLAICLGLLVGAAVTLGWLLILLTGMPPQD